MAKLVYFIPASLDGFIAGENDRMDWSVPNDEVMTFITEAIRPVGTYLYGRKNYETMTVWETPEDIPGLSSAEMDFARVWQAADKIVYSKSLETVATAKTRLEREFDLETVRDLKAQSPHDLSVAGPNLAAQAIRAGLVDEFQLLVVPYVLGGGKRVLPGNVSIQLELLDERRIGNGWVYLRYRTHA